MLPFTLAHQAVTLRWPMPCGGSALLQDPVALPCRWASSFSCTQTLPPRLQYWSGVELGVCGTYSFNDRAWGQEEDEGEGERLENCLQGAPQRDEQRSWT